MSGFLDIVYASLLYVLSIISYLPEPTIQDLGDSTVNLFMVNQGQGSGVVVSTKSTTTSCELTIVTAKHVIEVGKELILDHTPELVPDRLQAHQSQDIGYLVYTLPHPCATYRYKAVKLSKEIPSPLDVLIHIGYPDNHWMIGYTTYIGPYTSSDMYGNVLPLDTWAITSVAGPGSSGGPVFYKNQLLGIIVMGETIQPFRNYITPIFYLNDLLPELFINAKNKSL